MGCNLETVITFMVLEYLDSCKKKWSTRTIQFLWNEKCFSQSTTLKWYYVSIINEDSNKKPLVN